MSFFHPEAPPPIEDEIRFPDINMGKLVQQLQEKNARRLFDGIIIDYRYDTPSMILRDKYNLRVRVRKNISENKETFECTIKSDEQESGLGVRMKERTLSFKTLPEAQAAAEEYIAYLVGYDIVDLEGEVIEPEIRERERKVYEVGAVRFEIDRLTVWKDRGKDWEDLSFMPWCVDVEITYPNGTSQQEIVARIDERQALIELFGLKRKRGVPTRTHDMIEYFR